MDVPLGVLAWVGWRALDEAAAAGVEEFLLDEALLWALDEWMSSGARFNFAVVVCACLPWCAGSAFE